MNILIIGGNGYVGSNLKKLLEKDNITAKQQKNNIITLGRKNCDIIADITNFKTLKDKIKNFDVVFHLAAFISTGQSYKDPVSCFEVNALGTWNVMESCRINNIKNIIFTSSLKVYGKEQYLPIDEDHPLDPESPYGYSKLIAEKVCRSFNKTFNMNIKILRISNIYGPKQKGNLLIPTILKQLPSGKVSLLGGDSKRDFVYIDDVCDALKLLINKNVNTPINIGSGQSSSPADIVKTIEKITNQKLYLYTKKEDSPTIEQTNISLAKKLLNWEPTVSLEKGLTEILKFNP